MDNKRHHLIILGSFQRRIVIGSVLATILLTNLLLIAWYLLDPKLLIRLDTSDTLVIAVLELALLATVFYVSLLASNKIAGPMYAFDKVLQQIRSGDLSARLHLRHGDIFMDIADEMNQTFEALSTRIEQLKATTTQLQQLNNNREQQLLIDDLRAQLEILKSRKE